MNIRIYESAYKDMRAITMESPGLKITVIPESGGKIQSICDKSYDKELLVQSDDPCFKRSNYDSEYACGDVSGFDEIFPTIEPCFFPNGPWQGIRVPDHGEVWALPWSHSVNDNALTLHVHGVRFPYRLEKKIRFLRDKAFRISYHAENLSDFELPFIWAPHALWLCDEDMRIVLPPSVKKVISTCSLPNRLGLFGTIHDWPQTIVSGESYDICQIYPKYEGKCEKYYAMGDQSEGWCALQGTTTGYTIGMSYPINKVPYLGVWEGIMNGRYVTALEPCTGALDALDTAMQWGKARSIQPHSSYDWYLTVTLDNVTGTIFSIDADGDIK